MSRFKIQKWFLENSAFWVGQIFTKKTEYKNDKHLIRANFWY